MTHEELVKASQVVMQGLQAGIDSVPTVDVVIRKKGIWASDASCPFCGFQPWYEKDIHTLSFCPNCGEIIEL